MTILTSSTVLRSTASRCLCSRPFSHCVPFLNSSPTGSAKLFADAVQEEADERANESQRKSRLSFLENQHANWDGEERVEDTVLRMLVDKYKPLRRGTIRTAEEKLKHMLPSVRQDTVNENATRTTQPNWANEPILPAIEGHKPWLTTYKAPSHTATSIRMGRFPPASARAPSTPTDDRTRRKEKEAKRRNEVVGRLTKAKESTLDYRLGVDRSGAQRQIRPNPVSLRGWTSLIEDKIEVGCECYCALPYG
jgi:DnaJ homolog subfamily C member 28